MLIFQGEDYWKQTTVTFNSWLTGMGSIINMVTYRMPFDFFSSTYVDLRYIFRWYFWKSLPGMLPGPYLPLAGWHKKHTHPNKSWDIRSPFPQIWWFPPTRVSTGKFQPPTVRSEHFDIHRYGGISIATHPKLGFAHTFQHLIRRSRAASWRCPTETQGSWGKKKQTGLTYNSYRCCWRDGFFCYFGLRWKHGIYTVKKQNIESLTTSSISRTFRRVWRCWSYTHPFDFPRCKGPTWVARLSSKKK